MPPDQDRTGTVLKILAATDIDMVERSDQVNNLGGGYLDTYRPEEALLNDITNPTYSDHSLHNLLDHRALYLENVVLVLEQDAKRIIYDLFAEILLVQRNEGSDPVQCFRNPG